MTLDDYHTQWAEDSPIALDRLDEAAACVPTLHARYWKFYSLERRRFRKVQQEFKILERLRWEYWLGKLDDAERTKRGWPPQPLKILRTDVDRYLLSDEVLQTAQRTLIAVEETLKFLEDVIKQINNRNYAIKNSIDFLRFKNGG